MTPLHLVKTLEEAFQNFKDYHDDYADVWLLTWYEATEIKVERKVTFSILKPEAPKPVVKAAAKK